MCRLRDPGWRQGPRPTKPREKTCVGNEWQFASPAEYNPRASPQNPATLMPLILPFLNYDDTSVLKQLNSTFYNYITERKNATNMPKPNMPLSLELGIGSLGTRVEFSRCINHNPEEIYSCSTTAYVFDEKLEIDIRDHKRPFLEVFLDREEVAVSEESTDESLIYKIDSRAQGLRLLLNAITGHFAIGDVRLNADEDIVEVDLEVIRDCLMESYYPKWGKPYYEAHFVKFHPILIDIAVEFDANYCELNYDAEDGFHLLEMDSGRIPLLTQEFKQDQLAELIQDWKAGNRRINHITIPGWYGPEGFPEYFDKLCRLLGVDNRNMRRDDDEQLDYHWITMTRDDRTRLQVYICFDPLGEEQYERENDSFQLPYTCLVLTEI